MMKKISGLLSLAAVAGLVVWLSVLQGRLVSYASKAAFPPGSLEEEPKP
jgi:hypothetical protein